MYSFPSITEDENTENTENTENIANTENIVKKSSNKLNDEYTLSVHGLKMNLDDKIDDSVQEEVEIQRRDSIELEMEAMENINVDPSALTDDNQAVLVDLDTDIDNETAESEKKTSSETTNNPAPPEKYENDIIVEEENVTDNNTTESEESENKDDGETENREIQESETVLGESEERESLPSDEEEVVEDVHDAW